MDENSEGPEPANLRFLRLLVTVLTATMIAGVLGILALIVIRYQTTRTPLPPVITLPDGTEALAYTQAAEWYAVVTADDRILIFDRATGRLRQTLQIDLE
ncbi:DUF6476 family protein [Aestuariicoccus sp. MJ-SS9]|uniref:DUF6476 family protein n=1 Tax=Aestuariicoccus sp. MJ-SS9 TaxID=3079855 RepID=UPI002906BE18|nr:DUF6476 family protein [Aestuariicoccus sp. MJ-SS9]MDU8910248.1 DUF6476 family protein [Aestuariicoccus sp. MJ-SS9]